jgi:hypothetical protein
VGVVVKYLSYLKFLTVFLLVDVMNAMDPALCQGTFNNINHVKEALFKAIERNDGDCIRNLLSNNIVTQLDSRKKFGLCDYGLKI